MAPSVYQEQCTSGSSVPCSPEGGFCGAWTLLSRSRDPRPPQRLLAGRPSSEMETLGVQSHEIVLLKKNT